MKKTAVEKTQYIDDHLKQYIKSTLQINDPKLEELFKDELNKVTVTKGPYISINHPFKSGKSIRELCSEGIISNQLLKMKELKVDRPLYVHQEKAIRLSNEGINLVVSTGTGSGKTESFLIPILNAIAKEIDEGKEIRGVQALLLYPMNALANDQRLRIREILVDFPQITFGFYTGETQEYENKAKKEYYGEYESYPLSNEIISREVVRKDPPHILFTNYSMLEYILLRPGDKQLFESTNTSSWKYIVIDEAHTYRGTLGIEVSLLLRRLLGNIDSDPRFILTSATLASSEEEYPAVIEFAQKLTSKKFDSKSIIVADRVIKKRPSKTHTITPNIYRELLNNSDLLSDYTYKYLGLEIHDKREALYNLLINDSNYFDIIEKFEGKYQSKRIDELRDELGWDEDSLLSMVDVISFVSTSREYTLVDMKYHTFVRTLEGGYITVKPEKSFHLKRIDEHIIYNEDNEMDMVKAFELGLCKYCKSGYLIGRIHNGKFFQTDAEEIYEYYGEEYRKSNNILLVKDLSESDVKEIDMEDKHEMILCNKCGNIHDKDNLNGMGCSCPDYYQIETIMWSEEKTKNSTQITKCICCDSRNPRGIIDSFYMGKDNATSMIGQFLYNAIGSKTTVTKNQNKSFSLDSLLLGKQIIEEVKTEKPKQFLAFSDSRQQASFFAAYFENRHRHFLRKRLVVETVKENKRIDIKDLVAKIQYKMEKHNLDFEGTFNEESWISTLIELLDVDRKYSLSGMGLISFSLNIDISKIDEEEIREHFDGITKSEFYTILRFIADSLRHVPAINYFDDASLPYDLAKRYLEYRFVDYNGITLESSSLDKNSVGFIPSGKRGNRYSKFIMKALNVDLQKACEYLKKIWIILTRLSYLEMNHKIASYQMSYDKFVVSIGTDVDWYICDKCKTITDINLRNVCIKPNCDGTLDNCEIESLHKDNYYYYEYQNKEIENIRIEEHTAQINRKDGRVYQKEFQNGDINILSSSTTFEMGIDIGSLETVYMRNVPPTPANYVQRAGRAGRSEDSTAYVLTFCSNNSHDFSYFNNPHKMIDGKVSPPYFEINNEKILNRHILAVALSMFFKRYPEKFGSSEEFILNNGITMFIDYLNNHKGELIEFVEENLDKRFKSTFTTWHQEAVLDDNASLLNMFNGYSLSLNQLESYRDSLMKEGNSHDFVSKQIISLKGRRILDSLTRYNVIPSYSFPVDSVNLTVPRNTKYDLNRDLRQAISEYAPNSEIIVDKNKIRSRYINQSENKSIPTYFYSTCKVCNNVFVTLNELDPDLNKCNNCGTEYQIGQMKQKFIKPKYGFTSEIDESLDPTIKPKRTYSGDTYYLGNSETSDTIHIRDSIVLKTTKDNRLVILNENPFYMCESCGYTELEHETLNVFNTIEQEHVLPYSRLNKCRNKVLKKVALGHEYRTDVMIVEFINDELHDDEILSLMFSLLEGISESMEIDRNDISGIIQKDSLHRNRIILYDDVPGGAGHVKRLFNEEKFIKALETAFNKIKFECCDESTSCYNCLRNYRNQKLHRMLKRGKARDTLKHLLQIINDKNDFKYEVESPLYNRFPWEEIQKKDPYNRFYTKFISEDLPLADYAFFDLSIADLKFHGVFMWEVEKIVLAESATESEKEMCMKYGWHVYNLNDIEPMINMVKEI